MVLSESPCSRFIFSHLQCCGPQQTCVIEERRHTGKLFAAVVLYSALMLTFYRAYTYSSHGRHELGFATEVEGRLELSTECGFADIIHQCVLILPQLLPTLKYPIIMQAWCGSSVEINLSLRKEKV